MAITTLRDTESIKDIIEVDEDIKSYGFTSTNIVTANENDEEIKANTKKILIYPDGTRYSTDYNFSYPVYSIKIISTMSKKGDAMNACDKIIKLLHNTDIGNFHILRLYIPPGAFNAPSGVVLYKMSFYCETTIYEK